MTIKDPVRFLDGAGNAAELDLLRAGAMEEPSEAARQRLALALGLSIEPPIQAKGEAPGISRGAGAPGAVNAATPLSVKSLVVALVGLGTIGIGAVVASQLSRAPAKERARASAPTLAVSTDAPARPEPAASAPTPALAPAVRAGGVEPTPPSAAGPAVPRRGKSAALAREIAQLDTARALLASGNPGAALAALRDYAREHASGVLSQEAALLRIEALLTYDPGTRAHARARAEAAHFLRDNPQSPHANRIQALLDDAR